MVAYYHSVVVHCECALEKRQVFQCNGMHGNDMHMVDMP